MGLSLRNIGKKLWESITPQNEEALRQVNANLERANLALQQAPKNYGVFRNPQTTQQFIQQNQAPRFNLGRNTLSAFSDALTKPELYNYGVNVGGFKGSGLIEDFINSPIKIARGGVNVGQGNIKKGLGEITTGAIEGPLGLIPISRVAQAGKGAKLLPKVIAGAKTGLIEGGVSGGLYGGGKAASEGASVKDIVKQTGIGAVVGGVGGAVLGGATPVVTTAVKNRVPLNVNEVGSAKIRGKPKVSSKPRLERGFKGNLLKNTPDNLNAQVVAESIPGYKRISNPQTLSKAADEIMRDQNAAFARIVTKKQLDSATDVATGNLLLRQFIESGDMEAALQVGKKLGVDGTKLGQAVQAYATWKKTTPEGVITYASRKATKAGKELDQKLAQELVDKARTIADMPEGLEKAKLTRELLGQAEGAGRTWKDTIQEVLSAPRAAMATADLSAPLRQGAVLGSRFPKEFAKASVEMIKYFASPKRYEKGMYDIAQRPTYSLMQKSKLAVGGADGLTGTEEQFMKNILESKWAKKLGFGHVVAASNRAYTGFLTKLRADIFDKVVADASAAGVRLDAKATDSLAKFINSASGRGSGKMLDKHAGLLSQALFSPKLWKSRLDTLNPVYYARLDPMARKLALQSAASFAGIATTVLGLAKAAGASVENDPRSADFGKIKVGDTRYDILGGHQQNIRLAAQIATGEKINSVTGEIQTLGPERGFGKPSRLDLLYQFVENKENPVLGFGTKVLRGTDPVGNPINLATEAAKLAIPLNIQSTYETAKSQNSLLKGTAMNIPGTFGIGVQTYGQEKAPPKKPTATAKAEASYGLQQLDDGSYEYKIGEKTSKTTDLKTAQAAIAKDSLKKSDAKSKTVGDTYYYKTKSGDIKTQPKILHDYDQAVSKIDLELDRTYRSNDLNLWLAAADQKWNALEQKKQYYDPETEADEITKLTNQQEDLMYKAEGYLANGYIRKGSRGTAKVKSAGSPFKYAVSSGGGGTSARPRVTVRSGGLKSAKARTIDKPQVSLKKSLV